MLRSKAVPALAALLLAALLLLPGRAAVAADTLAVINQVTVDRFPEVVAYLTVVDSAGLPVPDLSKDQIRLRHNGQPVPDFTLDLAEAAQGGLSLVVAVDTSGSMQGEPLEHARAAARLFFDRMGPNDRGALISFGQTVQVVHGLTDDSEALRRALDGLTANGDTALYDGTVEAITLAAAHPLGRRAVVVITDGEDTHSRLSLEDVTAKARETNTPVSAIGFGEVMAEPLQRLTAATGGTLGIAPDADRLAERAEQAADLLRKQYVVRYRAPDSRPPENELEVTVGEGDAAARVAQRFPAPPMPPISITLPDLAGGGTVRGTVEVRPALTNATTVDAVEYILDGAPIGTVTEPPYAFAWDTTSVPTGEHTLSVRARLGEQAAQHDLALIVAPAVEVSITLPAGSEVTGTATLSANVAAGAPIQTVAWAVDGQPIGTAQQPPYAVEWDTASVPPGDHTVTAEAQDEGGNVGRASQTVRVAAASAAASPSPSTAAGSPVAAGTISTGTPVAAAATRSPDRTPTTGPDEESASGLGGISWPVWIGGGVLAALAVAVLVAATRRRTGASILAANSTPAIDPAALPQPEQPSRAGPPFASHTPSRDAETVMVSALSGPATARLGALGRSTVTVYVSGAPARPYPLDLDQFVGRAPGPGIIVVDDPLVSRRHARISWEDGHFAYRDLGPLNPTRRDGRTLPNPYILRDGDRLRIGHSELLFRS